MKNNHSSADEMFPSFDVNNSAKSFSVSFDERIKDCTSSSRYSPHVLNQMLRDVYLDFSKTSVHILLCLKDQSNRFDLSNIQAEYFAKALTPRENCKFLKMIFWFKKVLNFEMTFSIFF